MAIKTVAVIGAGTMGAGIAQVCAQSGWQTNLFDAFPESLEKGIKAIDAFWDKGIARGKTTQQQKQQWSQNLSQFTDMEAAVKQADLVIEAVPEIPKLKFQIFEQLGKFTSQSCILATNTSSLKAMSVFEKLNIGDLPCDATSIGFTSSSSSSSIAFFIAGFLGS